MISLLRCTNCGRYFEPDTECDDGMVIPGHPMKVLLTDQPPYPVPAEEFVCDLEDCLEVIGKKLRNRVGQAMKAKGIS